MVLEDGEAAVEGSDLESLEWLKWTLQGSISRQSSTPKVNPRRRPALARARQGRWIYLNTF